LVAGLDGLASKKPFFKMGFVFCCWLPGFEGPAAAAAAGAADGHAAA
jgi:hypothetical protein